MSSGQLIFKMFYRDQYKDIDAILNYQERLKAEKAIFGISSIELSCEIIKNYSLPETIYSILSKQDLDWQDEEFGLANAILKLACILAELDSKNMDQFELKRTIGDLLDPDLLKKFQMSELRLDTDFLAQLHEGTATFVNANH